MAYTFSPLSFNGVRKVQVDCTGRLKPLELLSSVVVTSLDTTLLTISGSAVNTSVLNNEDGGTIAVKKGCTFTVTSVRKSVADVPITLKYTGDDGTIGTVTITQPIVETS